MEASSLMRRLRDLALLLTLLAAVSFGFREIYRAAAQALTADAPFYDFYRAGNNPWQQALTTMPLPSAEGQRVAARPAKPKVQ